MVKTNSIKAWMLAARPKTLTAAAVPVILGIAQALYKTHLVLPNYYPNSIDKIGNINWMPAILCLLFAWVMQIDSNFVNDYFDFKHGNDDETRLGPKRACAEGWITLPMMKRGIIITTLLGCLIGLPLIIYGGIEMVIVGICCVIFCFLYTTKLSYLGLGDLLVLAFFGIVPVCCTYYLVLPDTQQSISLTIFLLSVACGFVVDCLLIVNNYRDFDNDKKAGKKTLIVKMGKADGEMLYLLLGLIAALIVIIIIINESLVWGSTSLFLPLIAVYIILHYLTWKKMKSIGEGKALNKVLGMTARNILVFGIVTALIIIGATWF